ncbi:hypothetical protein C121_26 [Stenotrophomonas phage C121]|uniref:hypothetical protein n=1 Tax=Stenotrophomonas phage C121 TaxID=2914029 RepID=UPI002329335D|nr:hypothetical protein PP752_gp26 [Stenotrophomonas phage C121]UKL14759.1 hypothetical protein C121_26 [Stenotrophomonas phage C121]
MTEIVLANDKYYTIGDLAPATYFTYCNREDLGKAVYMRIKDIWGQSGSCYNCVCIHPGKTKDVPGQLYRALDDYNLIVLSKVVIHD